MVDSVSKPITTKTTLTNTEVQDVSTKTTDGKATIKATDKPTTVKTETTGKGEGAPPIRQPKLDASSIAEMVEALRAKLDDTQQKTKADQIESAKKKIDSEVKKQLDKIEEQFKKMESQKKWGLFGKIFGGIAMGLALVAACATLNPVVIGVAVAATTLYVLQETGVMDKALTGLLDKMGIPKEDQGWWKLGINLAMSAVLMLATCGAAGSVSAVSATAKTIRSVSMIAGGVMTVAGAASQAGATVKGYEAEMAKVDLKKLQAKMLESQHTMDELVKQLKALLEKIEQGADITSQVVSAEDDSISKQMQMMKSKA